MGPGEGATANDCQNAYQLGQLIADRGWVLLTGGRNVGVMEAANRGAKANCGLTIGILPTAESDRLCEAVDLPIFTDLGNARNNINVLSSQVIVACGIGLGTTSEVALALKAHKSVILLAWSDRAREFFQSLAADRILVAHTPPSAIACIDNLLKT